MTNPMGESENEPLRLDFDHRLKLDFHGSKVTSDAGLLAYRELDDALGLSGMVGDQLVDPRPGKNGQHAMTGLFRRSVFGRLGGYEDVNDADRLGRDPAMRWIVGGRAVAKRAASTSQMGRFETEVLTRAENQAALVDLSGRWIDTVHSRRLWRRQRETFDGHSYGEKRRERCALLTENRAVSGRARPCLTGEATSALLSYSRLPQGAQMAILTLGTGIHLGNVGQRELPVGL